MPQKSSPKIKRRPRPLVRFDWFIKYLSRNKIDFKISEGFLSELLKENIAILEIVESESNKQGEIDKFNRVDVLVKTQQEERIIIEVQNAKEFGLFTTHFLRHL